MRTLAKRIGCMNVLSLSILLSTFSASSVAVADDLDLIFVSDFYDKTGALVATDNAYLVAQFIQNSSVSDVLATEVNNSTGTAAQYNSYIDPVWSPFKSITHAVPGNHDYYVANAAGFKSYFNVSTTYSSFTRTVGSTTWKIIGLDSNMASNQTQQSWLDQQLDGEQCSIVYFHHPRWSSGNHGSNASMDAIWRILAAHNVELAISGHDHNFERFWPKDADGNWDYNSNGVVQVVAGVGGASLTNAGTPVDGSIAIFAQNTDPPSQPGVLMIHLYDFSPMYLGAYLSAQGEILHYWWGSCY